MYSNSNPKSKNKELKITVSQINYLNSKLFLFSDSKWVSKLITYIVECMLPCICKDTRNGYNLYVMWLSKLAVDLQGVGVRGMRLVAVTCAKKLCPNYPYALLLTFNLLRQFRTLSLKWYSLKSFVCFVYGN